MPRPWRLILDGRRGGAWNMGVDLAVLEAAVAGTGPPTLRVYGWSTPTVSLGRFQDARDVDLDACCEAGLDVVRRPTGGRGVLHDREVTYSVVATEADGLPRGVRASYERLSLGLVEAYRRLGVAATLTARQSGSRSAACYLLATAADLTFHDAKLSGSAQVWRDRACLQHGSVVLERDVATEGAVFRLDAGSLRDLAEHAVSLAELLGDVPGEEQVVEAVAEGFRVALGVDLVPGGLTEAETERAHELAELAVIGDVRGSR